ncbi:MAG: DUF3138 family protein [Burkholderiaceae bacterium]|nr:DUF3138 family protein [Burkholderiaceae bacterium]
MTSRQAAPLMLAPVVLALAAAFPLQAAAQGSDDLVKELRALKEKVAELEKKLEAKAAAPAPAERQWGMTPEQVAELNRVAVKAEALEDGRDAAGLKLLKISGYVDPTFVYNRAQDRAGFQFLNRVDDDGYNYDNSYFGAAVIDFQKETDSGTRWRLTLAPNRGVGAVVDGASPVHEASLSVPLGSLQTRFIAGQVPDWSGYEYLQPTLNKLITHNLLFDFTLPTAYTGAGMEYTRSKWLSKVMLANVNMTRKGSGNKTPALAYRVDYAKGEFQGFGFAGVHGKLANFRADETDADDNPLFPDQAGKDTMAHLFEVDAYFIRGDVTWQGQLSYGTQKDAAITAGADGALRDARWMGLSTLLAYKWTPRFETIARFDYLNNKKNGGGLLGYTSADGRNGIGPDPAGDPEKGANRMALSMGASYLWDMNTTFKAEYRLDRANLPVFEYVQDGLFKKSNHLFGASVIVSF